MNRQIIRDVKSVPPGFYAATFCLPYKRGVTLFPVVAPEHKRAAVVNATGCGFDIH